MGRCRPTTLYSAAHGVEKPRIGVGGLKSSNRTDRLLPDSTQHTDNTVGHILVVTLGLTGSCQTPHNGIAEHI